MKSNIASELNILGVDYTHVVVPGEGDLYLTKYGRPFMEHLHPRNWYESEWFAKKREKLAGSSSVYRTPTKPVEDRSIDLVVKWCRVGEVVPIDTMTLQEFTDAEFNSPYEEFSLVMEMRERSDGKKVRTHKPLAIFVPHEKVHLWQSGRSTSRMARKKAKFRDVELDIYRQYILIYEWVKGVSAIEAYYNMDMPDDERLNELQSVTERAIRDLQERGFRVLDMKPAHVILRPKSGRDFLKDRNGEKAYALVDFELLERTPEHEEEVVGSRRAEYLVRQRDRFDADQELKYPPHLQHVNILGVDYVHGQTESTHGQLWVAGRDPSLFDYFQPERWRRTPRETLSRRNSVHYTRSKDNIHLVWRVSRVGEKPEIHRRNPNGKAAMEHGFNSPFEEFAMAIELANRGLSTIYPRAIYMTGHEAEDDIYVQDDSRYRSHAHFLAQDGLPILRHDHNYITVWGYWNGSDELLAVHDGEFCRGVSGRTAHEEGIVDQATYEEVSARAQRLVSMCGYTDLNFKDSHYLLTLAPDNRLVRNTFDKPAIRYCSFSLLKKTGIM